MRREELYLTDMLEAADAIGGFLQGISREQFLKDDLLRSGVLQKLTIIGEAAARLPMDFCKRHPGVEWADIAAFRNIAVHEYFAIQWPIVWVTATKEVPELKAKVEAILREEYPNLYT
jgi:uncharacterized protein with HEPN domain